MNLLNELNSWRVGESFAKGSSDAQILETLRGAYGAQAGWGNVQIFADLWTADRVQGRSVPRLIRASVLALNRLDEAGAAQLGRQALTTDDPVPAHDFMRLVLVRYPDRKNLPLGMTATLEALRRHPDEGVAAVARRLLPEEGPPAAAAPAADDVKDAVARIADPALPREETQRLLAELIGQTLREDGPRTAGSQKKALAVLEKLMDAWKLETIYAESKLASINSLGNAIGRAQEPASNRAPQPGHVFFAMDSLLAQGLFDGQRSEHRLQLVNLIRTRTYPEELPLTQRKLVESALRTGEDMASLYDRWLALMMLVPGKDFFSAHLDWPESLAEAIRRAPAPPIRALEFCGEYYREALAPALPGPTWGKWTTTRLDAATRAEASRGLAQLLPGDRQRYDKALEHLAVLIESPDLKVRIAARFAIASYPGYLLGLEPRLAQALRGAPGLLRTEAVTLLSMTQKGFLPEADAAPEAGFAPTAEEAALLGLRGASAPAPAP